ncbi:MAG: hypothetical protein COU33_01400 [Candidatus Magasanikbacteria bacterium CG10_big_fil_rev_8_21_14_0_10_43_6]|uniref:Uncharacterized protein n=1 Tax=Candidatus Magasanikbacteria bacterium CG10_big_fil_rev_8_21_14_0_10_43_6 TaxID=1974650 RepID=A0A2M6W1R7_9BACT|nr:MAG: hypothetical protein COU33_01400 [Candidatus Magasanikbacteria bacterium CG10_big_fil_rev_8_21_14_0_10_43_6]
MPYVNYRPTKKHFIRAFKISIVTALVVGLMVLVNSAPQTTWQLKLFATGFTFCMTFFIVILIYKGLWAGSMITKTFEDAEPNTTFTKRADTIPEPPASFTRRASVFLGVTLFIVLLDMLLVAGMLVGWAYLNGGLNYSELGAMADGGAVFFGGGEEAAAWWFVFFLVFVYAAGRYTWGLLKKDPNLKRNHTPSPVFVFHRAMIMWLTFGHGETVRYAKGEKHPRTVWHVMRRMLFGALIGLPFDLAKKTFWMVPLLVILAAGYELLLSAYRIDRSHGDKIKRVDV